MTISPLDLILWLGSVQGFILATLLWFNPKGHRLSNRLLAWLVGLLALACLAVSLPVQIQMVSLFVDLCPLIMVMPMGPLIYFYTRSLLDPTFSLGKWEKRQFWPVVIDWGSKLIGWGFIVGVLLGWIDHQENLKIGFIMDEYDTYADIPRWLSMTCYLLLTHRWIRQYEQTNPSLQQLHLRWLRQFMAVFLAFQTIWLLHLIPYIIPSTRNALLDAFGWYPLYIPIAIMIYWLGLRGYLHSRQSIPDPISRKAVTPVLAQDQIDNTISRLQRAMADNKLYLDPELTVDKVGRHLGLPAKTVSAVLNQHLGKSFNSFVNEYRIDEVKQRLNDPTHAHLTLMGIAFDCGFNSQATFQRTFKQMTGFTPKEFASQQAVYHKITSQIWI